VVFGRSGDAGVYDGLASPAATSGGALDAPNFTS
jgi:hypothetical protein